jgi:peptide/nickel transport system ATP-binding protein
VTGSRIELGDVLLEVENLKKHFPMKSKGIIRRATDPVKAVDGISFELRKGETLGIVGESGCGKSTAGRTVLQLLAPTEGTIRYKGRDITGAKTADLRRLRTEMQMVFQDPYGSLNPRQSVGAIIGAPFAIQRIEPDGGVKAEVQQLMQRVGLNPEHYNRYPHEFSGGQRQRIGIARAIALRPSLIVCDEPVSALDVSIQAQILNLLSDLQNELNLTYLFIAHDLSVVKHISDRVTVMYLGKIVESAVGNALYTEPKHPYTGALLSAVPIADPRLAKTKKRIILEGDVPSPINPPSGCRFHPRCYVAQERCSVEEPELRELAPDHIAACHFPLQAAIIEELSES